MKFGWPKRLFMLPLIPELKKSHKILHSSVARLFAETSTFSGFQCIYTDFFSHSSSNCTDGYLKIYLKGQETMDAYDKYDHEFCGTEKPYPVVSEGPRLVMVFSSGELQGRGFKV